MSLQAGGGQEEGGPPAPSPPPPAGPGSGTRKMSLRTALASGNERNAEPVSEPGRGRDRGLLAPGAPSGRRSPALRNDWQRQRLHLWAGGVMAGLPIDPFRDGRPVAVGAQLPPPCAGSGAPHLGLLRGLPRDHRWQGGRGLPAPPLAALGGAAGLARLSGRQEGRVPSPDCPPGASEGEGLRGRGGA